MAPPAIFAQDELPVPTTDLSIIIVTYNSTQLALRTLDSYRQAVTQDKDNRVEIIVVDNCSSARTADAIAEHHPEVQLIRNPDNFGYSRANNIGFQASRGRYLLFSNPDIEVYPETLPALISLLDESPDVGACTPFLELMKTGKLDWSAHRGFPTPWSSFTYMAGLSRCCRISQRTARWFGGYHLLDRDLSSPHHVDVIEGGFTFIRREVFQAAGHWDEDYFLFGEDIDLCLQIAEQGFKIMFYPQVRARHLMGSTTGLKKESPPVDPQVRAKSYHCFYDAMRLFYDKNYKNKYGPVVRGAVLAGIETKRFLGRRKMLT